MFETFELNGKKCCYMKGATKFLVQIGKGKGSYRTKYSFDNPSQAVTYFNSINIGNGYKKRLYVPSFNKPTLARVLS